MLIAQGIPGLVDACCRLLVLPFSACVFALIRVFARAEEVPESVKFALRTGGPEFDSKNPHEKKLCVVAHACVPCAGEVEKDGSLASQPHLLAEFQSSEGLPQKIVG